MAGEGEGEDVDDPGYAKFSRDLENVVGALGYAYHYQAVDAVGAAGDVDAPEEYVYE